MKRRAGTKIPSKHGMFHVKHSAREALLVPVQKGWFFSRRAAPAAGADAVAPDPPEGASLESIPIDRIAPNPFQPRRLAEDDPSLDELAASIKTHGLLQPILVTRDGEGFRLVAGERRWRAAAQAGLTAIPALVGQFSAQDMAENALIENLQRRDLSCLEEAEAYQRLRREFGLTQEALAARLGLSQPAVANKLRLLRLPPEIQEHISREIISEGHARALLMLEGSPELQTLACEEIVRRALSVREAEELVRGMVDGARSGRNRNRRQVVRVFKDARLFRNSVLSLVSQMEKGGAAVEVEEETGPDFYEVRVRVRKKADGGGAAAAPAERTAE